MSIKEHNDLQSIKLKPIISYPCEAQVGKSYLMSIDVELATSETPWPYPEEEYAISFILETRPFFSYEPLGGHEPSIVLHRFGGTYGPAEYLMTAAREEVPKGTIGITFVNGWGIPIANMELDCEVKQEVELDLQHELTIIHKSKATAVQSYQLSPTEESANRTKDFVEDKVEEPVFHADVAEEIRDVEGEQTNTELVVEQLLQTGWIVQEYNNVNVNAHQGIAIREFPLLRGVTDFLLVVNKEAVGVIEIKKIGETLLGVEEQITLYRLRSSIEHEQSQISFARSELPFAYTSTGIETYFTNYLEPEARNRQVFTFHCPETLALWLSQAPPSVPDTSNNLLRARLRRMPPVQRTGLRNYQIEAISNLEKSLAENRPRTLIQMATGTGKTQVAVSSLYRLLKYGRARRVLYLVDRSELALQASAAFAAYAAPDDESKFTDLYHVQLLQDNKLDPTARVCISTIQRLDSMLGIQPKIDRMLEEESSFGQEDLGEDSKPREVTYNPAIPIEYFDIIIIDECHRSIYGKWRPAIEYFDAFIIGITGILDNNRMRGFFNNNVVYEQRLEESRSSQTDLIVQRLWSYCNILRDDGMSSDDYLEQLTYLLFLKVTYEQTRPPYNQPSHLPKGYDWESLLRRDNYEMKDHYSRILEILGRESGLVGIIFHKAQNKIQDRFKLRDLIFMLDKESISILDGRITGDIYEELLKKSAENSKTGIGEYLTPRPLIQAIVDVMRPEPAQHICDPACGTGGFLIAAHDYIAENNQLTREETEDLKNSIFRGWERLSSPARLCAMNLFLHGIGSLDEIDCPVIVDDSLSTASTEVFDMVLCNPPFGRRIEGYRRAEIERRNFWVSTSDSDLLYIQHVYSLLNVHARAAIVVPNGVLFRSGPSEIIRRRLLEDCDLHTVLRLPENLFYYTGISTNVLFFDKLPAGSGPRTKQVWIYDLRTNKKFSPRRNPITRADFDDFVVAYNPQNRYERRESERFRAFSYEELVQREGINLNFSWLQE